MDFCVTGAPGSGKSDFALDLALALDQGKESWVVIDGYADEVRKETKLALGGWAGWGGNFIVAAERLKAELSWYKREQQYIVVGSAIETIVYFSLNGSSSVSSEDYTRVAAFMKMMSMLIADFHVYGVTFFLPLPTDHEDYWLSQEIETALDVLGVPYARLSEENRLDQALTIIEQARAALEAPKPVERRVRPRGSDGGEDRSLPNDVPNLSKHGSDGIGQ